MTEYLHSARHDQLKSNLEFVRQQIASAATASGRSSDDITLVAVTKTWPLSDTEILAGLGIADVGENKVQDLAGKRAAYQGPPLHWHFIGQLQRNKAKLAVANADMIHSVDRPELVTALQHAAEAQAKPKLDCLIQINLDPDSSNDRGGVQPEDVPRLADLIADSRPLSLAGVMAVAPLGARPEPAFEKLRNLHQKLLENHPHAWRISAGMSHDFQAAIASGATHVRMGAALLGQRPIPGTAGR